MKAYSLDLRKRVVAFVRNGGRKTEEARRFGIGRDTVCRLHIIKHLRPDAAAHVGCFF
ncbi:MAG: IS630 transposase-related protein [Kiritimatiellaeota bacterium]|nr:IS630 transposase-related protein [Kiritimatiellota bacterium]